MKAEYVLKWMTAAQGHLKQGANGNAAEIIEALKQEAAAEIRREEAKRSGTADRQKAAERVIKSAKADKYHEALHGAWMTADGMQNLCDGFQAYRLREALPLEEIPANVQPIYIDRIVITNGGDVVPLPELSELRAYIKTEKARIKALKKSKELTPDKSAPIWDFGDDLPQVRAEYLLNALELLPNCTAYARKKNEYIYFESDAGAGLILPIRKA